MITTESYIKTYLNTLMNDDKELLFACESGSRAWGFASEDSDYDVRFIYKYPYKKYLSLKSFDDTITRMDDPYDFHGWDLRKTILLAIATNPSLVEWVQSPIVYFNNGLKDKLKKLLLEYGNMYALAKSYQSLVANIYKEKILKKEPTAKAYLYCIRSMLAYYYIDLEESLPPIEIKDLEKYFGNFEVTAKIDYLITAKQNSEKNNVIANELLNRDIEKFLKMEPFFKPKKIDNKPFQDLFYEILGV